MAKTAGNNELEKQLEIFRQSEKTVVIFGAGVMGRCMAKASLFLGKEVAFFIDNDAEKQAHMTAGKRVLTPEEAYCEAPEAQIFLSLGSRENICTARRQLQEIGFREIHERDILYYTYQLDIIKRDVDRDAFAKTIQILKKKEEHLTLYMVGVVTTQVCTLKCKNCSLLIPFYKNPVHYAKEDIIKGIKNLAQAVDAIEVLTLLGGESLLHPDIEELCRELSKIPNIDRIHILTNGTIIPKGNLLERIRHDITYLQINDYGVLSTHKQELKEYCIREGIECDIYPESNIWYPVTYPEDRHRNQEENETVFRKCPWGRNFMEYQNGQFHICGYSATGTSLGEIPGSDFVDCLDERFTSADRRKKIQILMKKCTYIEACRYCGIDFENMVSRAGQKS